MKKALFLVIVSALLVGCKYTEAPSAGLAKEMCSCLFISGQDEDYCRSVTKESRILASFVADYNRKEVWARGAGFKAMARLDDNARYGCSIQIVEPAPDSGHDRERNDR